MTKRRVVVTGLGMLSPLGLHVNDTWQALLAGQSGVRPISQFDTEGFSTRISASVQDFDPTEYMSSKDARKTAPFVQFGVAAAMQAVVDAKLDLAKLNKNRIGVCIGSGIGGLSTIEANHAKLEAGGPRKVSPFFIPGAIINMVAGLVSIHYGFKGPNVAIVTACTTGSHSIGEAAWMIRRDDADVMLAGGAEMATSPLGIAGFGALRALSTRNDAPEKASRPWDKDRDGFVLGDGAGVLILEEYQHAVDRGATIYAELTGYGLSADGYHMTAPEPEGEGAIAAMQHALRSANMQPDAIQYINPHATSTPLGDTIEAAAIKNTFGKHAYDLAVSSTKSMIGHLLGAAGAVEAIFCVLALRDQIVPPTINLDNPDEGCDLDFVPHQARELTVTNTMSNSFGFGGGNASLIFSKLS